MYADEFCSDSRFAAPQMVDDFDDDLAAAMAAELPRSPPGVSKVPSLPQLPGADKAAAREAAQMPRAKSGMW